MTTTYTANIFLTAGPIFELETTNAEKARDLAVKLKDPQVRELVVETAQAVQFINKAQICHARIEPNPTMQEAYYLKEDDD
jgi:hypothetical protein